MQIICFVNLAAALRDVEDVVPYADVIYEIKTKRPEFFGSFFVLFYTFS